jgi:hypothetical protein
VWSVPSYIGNEDQLDKPGVRSELVKSELRWQVRRAVEEARAAEWISELVRKMNSGQFLHKVTRVSYT